MVSQLCPVNFNTNQYQHLSIKGKLNCNALIVYGPCFITDKEKGETFYGLCVGECNKPLMEDWKKFYK